MVLQLIELAIRGGGPDNITCIVADVIDTDHSKFSPTRAPVIAGAAASVGTAPSAGNAQTMQFSRPMVAGDPGMTTVGAAQSSGWPLDPAAAEQSAPRSGTRPGTVPVTAKAAPRHADPMPADDESDDYPARRTRRVPIMTVLIALFVVLIGGGLVVGYQVIKSQYYVGSQDGKVAIFRGINDKVLGFSLFSVYTSTDIPVSGITVAARQELARADTGNLAMANQFVTNIRKQYNACQSAHKALRAWIAGKPKPVTIKKRIDGHVVTRKVTPPYHKPKPTIPSYCPPQSGTST